MIPAAFFVAGVLVGALLVWIVVRQNTPRLEDSFRRLSTDALTRNNESFLELAKKDLERLHAVSVGDLTNRQTAIDQMLVPVRDGLAKYQEQLHQVEKERVESFTKLFASIANVGEMSAGLQQQTTALARAMTNSSARGAWGEIQLKRICELAGMVDHCDFTAQDNVTSDAGRLRPDIVVRLPGDRQIVVDAKAPFDAYAKAIACDNVAERAELLKKHAASVRQHAAALGKKAYWEQFDQAPEFVVLFLPAESFFSAALEGDPGLIEDCVAERVVLATPTTLIALLKAVSYGWRQEQLAQHAERISDLGRDLYKRFRTLGDHFARVGDRLGGAVDAYNKAVGSLESSVLPQARKFEELGAGTGDPIAELRQIEITPRRVQAPELVDESSN
jgi:DNA recombination protein RmuC